MTRGFTLLELLVTTGIVGILAALSVSNYNLMKGRFYDTKAISDVNSLRLGEFAYQIDNTSFVSCVGTAACEAVLPGYQATDTVGATVGSGVDLSGQPYFLASACSSKGTDRASPFACVWPCVAPGAGYRLVVRGREDGTMNTKSPLTMLLATCLARDTD